MAFKAKYEYLDQCYDSAYFKIAKLSISNTDREVVVEHSDASVVEFKKVTEAVALVQVYSDEEARHLNVRPINTFGIKFKYELNQLPFETAYNELILNMFKGVEVINV